MGNDIKVTQDENDPKIFHVTGRRIQGTVRASIGIKTKEEWNGNGREQVEAIGVTTQSYGNGLSLSINGVEVSGYRAVRINGWRRGEAYDFGYLSRKGGGEATSAAYSTFSEISERVADLYGTDENVYAKRVELAEAAVSEADEAVIVAERKLNAAQDARAAIVRAGVQPIARPAATDGGE